MSPGMLIYYSHVLVVNKLVNFIIGPYIIYHVCHYQSNFSTNNCLGLTGKSLDQAK